MTRAGYWWGRLCCVLGWAQRDLPWEKRSHDQRGKDSTAMIQMEFGSCRDCTEQHTYEDACRFRLGDDGSVLHLMSVTTAVLTDE